MTRRIVSTVHAALLDDPIEYQAQDALGRASFASSLAALIDNAPPTGSVRFGIYGEWGEGKTSVMRMIATDLRSRGHVTVPFSPWEVKDVDQAWDLFLRNLEQQLRFSRAPYVVSRLARRFLGQSGSLTDLSDTTKPLKAFVAPAVSLTEAATKGARRMALREAREALGARRLTVFVDDLDRVAPGVAPQLLMSLRETFSVPGFHYVLGLSPSVITEGLRQGGYTGSLSAEHFLDKIIEYPHYLPAMGQEGASKLIALALQIAPGIIKADALNAVARVLPTNPRRLKLFLRHLISLREHTARLSEDEINWPLLYSCLLLRLEFPASAQQLGKDKLAIKALSSRAMLKALAKQNGTRVRKDRAARLHLPANQSAHARYHDLLKGVAAHTWNLRRYELSQVLHFVDSPPVFTWKEANECFSSTSDAPPDKRRAVIGAWIGDANEVLDQTRANALFIILIDLRDAMLDHATEATTPDAAAAFLENAHKCAELLGIIALDLKGFASAILNDRSWIKLYEHASKWARLFRDLTYTQARTDERELLQGISHALGDDVAVSITNNFFARAHAPRTQDRSAEFQELAESIQTDLEVRAAQQLVAAFATTDGLEFTASSQLYDSNSAFHSEAVRAMLMQTAARASTLAVVQENFYEYLRNLLSGAYDAGSALAATDCRTLLHDEEFLAMIWRAATARSLALRSIGSLLHGRRQARLDGIPNEAMPIPRSWAVYGAAFPDDLQANAELVE
jgi:hypothetical protein